MQAEVLYGVLGATSRLNDPEAAVEVMRIYNEWLADFCAAQPGRFAGLASIPNNPIDAAIAEVERVAKRGALRGLDIANSPDLKPLWDPYWNPLWEVINATGLPLHFHTVGGYVPDHIRKVILIGSDPTRASARTRRRSSCRWRARRSPSTSRRSRSTWPTSSPRSSSAACSSASRASGWCSASRASAGSRTCSGGWTPSGRTSSRISSLKMPPSEYWKRQCWATYQTDPIGVKLLDELGADKVMWGSDFPHPDGVWPDSRSTSSGSSGICPPPCRRKIVCENAAHLYGFSLA